MAMYSLWSMLYRVPSKTSSKCFVSHKLQCQLQSECTRWFTDNQNVVRIVLNGSKTSILQKLALEIFQTCVAYLITIEPERISREWLVILVKLYVDYNDWMVHPSIFLPN